MIPRTLWLCGALLVMSCSSPDFEANCEGEVVPNCLPYESSIIQTATLTPESITVDDLTMEAEIRVEMTICPNAPRPHELNIEVRVGEGEDARLIELLMLRDDGMTEGDTTAGDGIIDVTVVNPFMGARFPENQDVFLRFTARAPADCSSGMCVGGTCRSEEVEIPYRTGPRLMRR